jgi:hypothetical protein
VFHGIVKHVEIDFHFFIGRVARKLFGIRFISSQDQVAYIFIKPLAEHQFRICGDNLNLVARG